MRYLLLLTLSLCALSSMADALPDDPYLSVTGRASLEVKADQVIIQFQPSVVNKSGKLAKQQLDQKVALAVKNLKASGFNVDAIESLSQSTRPEYDYQKNERILRGVRVTHELRYRLTEIDKVNDFLDALLNAQIEMISPLQYGLQDPKYWQAQVRKEAVLDSKQKAKNLAQLYDAQLGKVYSVVYQDSEVRPMQVRTMALMESDTLNIKPQNIILKDRVNSTFILKP